MLFVYERLIQKVYIRPRSVQVPYTPKKALNTWCVQRRDAEGVRMDEVARKSLLNHCPKEHKCTATLVAVV